MIKKITLASFLLFLVFWLMESDHKPDFQLGKTFVDVDKVGIEDGDDEQVETEELYLVTRVVDGDTIDVVINGEEKRVRYIGIDTPELARADFEEECFAVRETEINKDLVLGKEVRLEKDTSETDKYDRLLRYVYIDNVFVNEVLVESGAAETKSYYPDTKAYNRLKSTEVKAKKAGLGIWSEACTID